jgi:hypothetical protein
VTLEPLFTRPTVAGDVGAQAGEKKLTAVIRAGGFNHVRRACNSSTNMILEARRQA